MPDTCVLVVDDDPTVLELLKRFLFQRGFSCTLAADGAEALRLIEDRFFDLLLTDIRMPGMDGLELVQRVRSLQPHTVCILMSGMGTRRDIITALKAGVFDFLEKPFPNLAELGMVVDRAAANSRLMQERDALVDNLRQQNAQLEFSLLRLHEAFGQLRQQEEVLEADLLKAQRVQRKFLPEGFPEIRGLDLFGYFGPCEHLGGDFFGVIPLGHGSLAVYMVDVAGHGVSAAMVTVTLRELMRTQQRLPQDSALYGSPARVLSFINEALIAEAFDPPIFVSMVYAVFDPDSGRVEVASAGHPAPLLVSGPGRADLLAVGGPILGVGHAEPPVTAEVHLGPGDILLFYSDGLTEARNSTDGEFTTRRLGEALGRCHGWRASRIGAEVERGVMAHLAGQPAADDMTFIVACRASAVPALETGQTGSEPTRTGGHVVPNSVKMAMPHHLRYVPPPQQGRIKGGYLKGTCVIRLAGLSTWQLGTTFRDMLGKARAERAHSIQVDLAECEAMDSTMLGLLLQNARCITLHQPGVRVVGQLHEMGVWDLFSISHEPCLVPDTPLAIEPTDTVETCSELILAAHEALMEASTNNQERFRDVVATLRQQLQGAGRLSGG